MSLFWDMLHSKLTSSLLIYQYHSFIIDKMSFVTRPNEMVLWVGFAFGVLAVKVKVRDPWQWPILMLHIFWYLILSIQVVSILPPRFWWQQISWSYCAASRTLGLMAWRNFNLNKKVSLVCCSYASHLVCHCFSVRLSPCRLLFSFFFSYFFQNLNLLRR